MHYLVTANKYQKNKNAKLEVEKTIVFTKRQETPEARTEKMEID